MLSETKREGAGAPPADKAPFDPQPGTVVADKYRVDRTLGEGGMGLVVAATHLGLDQQVAIKFLLPHAIRSKEAVERFLREAKVAAKINNEHVARVHDVGTLDGGGPYIVMEHLEGSDLGQLIDRQGALPMDEACEIALQACEALVEVHAAGIVHRDLKPSNLFVTRRADGSPSVKLLDFGISKLTAGSDDASVDPALTTTATIMGSPSYMSPEQLKSTKEVDQRADVWSLGAVLYEALTAKPAFRGESVPQVCAMIASEDPVPPSSLRQGLPADLEHAILRCLEKKPDQRGDLLELARALANFAPERARVSLERIEGKLGVAESKPRTPTLAQIEQRKKVADLPILPFATPERARTQSSWGQERRGKRGGGGALVLLLLLAGGVLGVGLYSGRFNGVRGQLAGATSAVTSAAGAVSSAVSSAVTSAVASSLPSSLPDIPLPSAIPLPLLPFDDSTASAEPSEEPTENDMPPTPRPFASPSGPAPAPVVHTAPTKPHVAAPKPRHKWHRRH